MRLCTVALALALGGAGVQPAEAQTLRVEGLGHTLGDPDAPVEVVEFVDMGCRECRKFSEETFPEIHREYVETGKVFWRVIPYVSGLQPNGAEGARAVECAANQDAFWAMHDILFQRQRDWLLKMRPQRQYGRYAEELSLDEDRFDHCWDEELPDDRIRGHNRAAGRAGVRATPTFFVNGRTVLGALPLTQFRQILETELQGG